MFRNLTKRGILEHSIEEPNRPMRIHISSQERLKDQPKPGSQDFGIKSGFSFRHNRQRGITALPKNQISWSFEKKIYGFEIFIGIFMSFMKKNNIIF